MNTVKFKGQEFPTRTFRVFLDNEEQVITISVASLNDFMGMEVEETDSEAQKLDETIYFYIEDDEIEFSAKKICDTLLDEPVEFIEELQ